MKLSKALQQYDYLLMNGPIKTRLEFEYGLKKADWELIQEGDTSALKAIFSQDIALCQQGNIPMILSGCCGTSCEHLAAIILKFSKG